MDTKRLVVIRHAKAEALAETDAERVLTERGRVDARALGAWLRQAGVAADAAHVSDAARTRETWRLVAEAAGWDVEPSIDGSLYGTDEDGALEIVRDSPRAAGTVVVVGHNPTVSMLVQMLDDGDGAEADLAGMPTATAAVLEFDGSWADLEPMCARLRAFHVGRADDLTGP